MDDRVSHAFDRVQEIDLSPICFKLSHPEHGEGWTDSEIREGRLLYLSYLALVLAFRSESVVLAPPVIADRFWHQHILDTRKYMSDCHLLFGEYLHHFPYFGLRGGNDAEDLARAGKLTTSLIVKNFSNMDGYKDVISRLEIDGSSNCAGSCASCRSGKSAFTYVQPASIAVAHSA